MLVLATSLPVLVLSFRVVGGRNVETTIGTWFAVLLFCPSTIFDELWFLATVHSQEYPRPCSVVSCLSSFLLGLNRRRTFRTPSNSSANRSLLLNVYIEVPESTTTSLSSGFITDGAGRHL